MGRGAVIHHGEADAFTFLAPSPAESASGTPEFFPPAGHLFLIKLGPSIPVSRWLRQAAYSKAGWRLFSVKPTGRTTQASFPSCGTALLPTTSTTMPDSNLPTEDSRTVEMGGVHTGDEAELARMGYKQELRCVQFGLSIVAALTNYQA